MHYLRAAIGRADREDRCLDLALHAEIEKGAALGLRLHQGLDAATDVRRRPKAENRPAGLLRHIEEPIATKRAQRGV